MKEAIQEGLKKLEDMGYLTWNPHFEKGMAANYILVAIESMTWREMKAFIEKET